MTWADNAIKLLLSGENATIYPKGNSMTPHIKSGQKVVVAPVKEIKKNDIVLVQMNARTVYLHFVKAVSKDQVQIGNAHGKINGWTSKKNVFGVVVSK